MSKPALLLVDLMNPLDFSGAERLAPAALSGQLAEPMSCALSSRGGNHVSCIFANDNFGRWQSQFDSVVNWCGSKGKKPAEIVKLLNRSRAKLPS
ncbi:MAG: cysteine hydrolase [Bradyrhizobium sp.]|nr:cysteine hydrolase [Bradyrhizobium sp.]